MDKITVMAGEGRMISEAASVLDRSIWEGARAALDTEVVEFIERMEGWRTESTSTSGWIHSVRVC
jgi:hypothetical protein